LKQSVERAGERARIREQPLAGEIEEAIAGAGSRFARLREIAMAGMTIRVACTRLKACQSFLLVYTAENLHDDSDVAHRRDEQRLVLADAEVALENGGSRGPEHLLRHCGKHAEARIAEPSRSARIVRTERIQK
jgi:hypothetical protein